MRSPWSIGLGLLRGLPVAYAHPVTEPATRGVRHLRDPVQVVMSQRLQHMRPAHEGDRR
jgi:hypothetical protein